MIKIPVLFKFGADGRVIPEINPECAWVLSNDNGLMTIKIDGICVSVEWPQGKSQWEISKRIGVDTWFKTDRTDPVDKPIWDAWNTLDVKQNGIYEVYGKGIKGNPHNINGTFMIKVVPVDYSLIVARGNSKIERGPSQTAKDLYDNILAEFMESPEIEGLVFHFEGNNMKLARAAKIRKKDFGLPWPPAKPIELLTAGPLE